MCSICAGFESGGVITAEKTITAEKAITAPLQSRLCYRGGSAWYNDCEAEAYSRGFSFFAKKGCEGVHFGVNYADIFRHEKLYILTF